MNVFGMMNVFGTMDVFGIPDLVELVSNHLTDKEFVMLITSMKTLYLPTYTQLKKITSQYLFSRIKHHTHLYQFINIFYDQVEWIPQLIPLSLIKIRFGDDFKEDFHEIFTYPNLKYIKVSIFYNNTNILKHHIPNTLSNKINFIITIIANRNWSINSASDIQRYHTPKSVKNMPYFYNAHSQYVIRRKAIQMKRYKVTMIDKFNSYLDLANEYERHFYLDNIHGYGDCIPIGIVTSNIEMYWCTVTEKMIKNNMKLMHKTYSRFNLAFGDIDGLMKLSLDSKEYDNWEKNKKEMINRKNKTIEDD